MGRIQNRRIFSFLFALIILSCNSFQYQIVIKNISQHGNVDVLVKFNDQEYQNKVPKGVSNFSGVNFFVKEVLEDSCKIEVIISSLNLHKTEMVSLKDIENIIITVRSVPTSFHPIISGDLKTIPMKDEILIGYFGKNDKKKAI